MSHFVLVSIIPSMAEKDISDHIDKIMSPYDESIIVSPHDHVCYCIGLMARNDVYASFSKKHGNLYNLREEYNKLPESEKTAETWEKMLKPYAKIEKALYDSHPLKDKPNPTCSYCDGTGYYLSESNPDGHWDWYEIGGRWHGWIYGPEAEKNARHNGGPLSLNIIKVSCIPIHERYYVPYAVLAPDEGWLESESRLPISGDMIDYTWHNRVKEVYAKYPDHLAVVVDCHT